MVVKTEKSLDQIVSDYCDKVSQYKEAKWEHGLMAVHSAELDAHMSDLDIITDKILCDETTQAALKFMSNTITQIAWTRMRKQLLQGIHSWYKVRLNAVRAGKALLAAAEVRSNPDIEDAEIVEELEDEMAAQFEATVEHIQQAGVQADSIRPDMHRVWPKDKICKCGLNMDHAAGDNCVVLENVIELTAEQAIERAMAEEDAN